MKVCMEDDIMIVYYFEKQIDFQDKEKIEDLLKEIFLKIKNKYQINFDGYYQILLYVDPFYGSVFEVKHEDFEYFFDQTIDMHITVNKPESFLYQVDSKPNLKGILYESMGNLYFELKEKPDFIDFGNLIEKANLIYDEEILKIKNKSTIVR